ncbi:MAG: glutathione S-transferase family protein [Hyphomicrobiaceae bacterium]
MGILVDGQWQGGWQVAAPKDGKFVRSESQFRNWLTADGSAGPTGKDGFAAEAGRYHLYVSLACPWAHRTLIFRRLKGLEDIIGLSIVNWHMGDDGWTFEPGPGVVPDPITNVRCIYEIYTRADPDYSGRVTVPVLWDKERNTIVSNESSEIIRMLNSAFDQIGALPGDFYPEEHRTVIDAANERIYETLNNGVYRCGFARSQEAYDAAIGPLFDTLDWLEDHLTSKRYIAGARVTEADWRLFPTLVRFDAVYHGHFKCNRRRIIDYPNLWAYTRDLYQQPKIAETVNLDHIRHHYYGSHEMLNPARIVPIGPILDFNAPHGREALV